MSTRRRRGHGEGAIYPRNDGRWAGAVELGWRDGKRQRKTVYGKTRKEVAEKINRLLRDHQEHEIRADERLTVEKYLTEWLQAMEVVVRPRTWRRYEELIRRHAVPHVGRIRLTRLSAEHLQHLYAELILGGLAAATVVQLHRILHNALGQAVRWDLVGRNVADLVKPPRVPRYELTTLSPEQSRQFLDAARGDRLEALYVLAITTGMRLGELLRLRWREVDLEARVLSIRGAPPGEGGAGPKTERSRRPVVLTEVAAAALRRHRAAQAAERIRAGAAWQNGDLVFANTVGGPLNQSNLRLRSFHPLLKRAGLPMMRFHDLRHSAATLLLGMGVHPKVVSEMLGHAQVSITLDVYSHVTATMQHQAVNALNDLLAVKLAVNQDGHTQKPQLGRVAQSVRAADS
jgi:integrase